MSDWEAFGLACLAPLVLLRYSNTECIVPLFNPATVDMSTCLFLVSTVSLSLTTYAMVLYTQSLVDTFFTF